MKKLVEAAFYGNFEEVQRLIKDGVDVNALDSQGYSALHVAAEFGKEDMVKLLIKEGANVNALDKWKRTPLHLAARIVDGVEARNKAEVAKALIESGADLALKDKNFGGVVGLTSGSTAMHYAVENGFFDIVEAIHKKNPQVINMQTGWRRFTPLHLAAGHGMKEVAEWLINNGADKEARDNVGNTPLHHALVESSPYMIVDESKREAIQDTIDGLVNKGVKIELENPDAKALVVVRGLKEIQQMREKPQTALHHDAIEGNVGEIEKYELDIDVVEWRGLTPLHYAAAHGQVDAIKALVKKGANLEAKDQWGLTPLHYAARDGYTKAAEELVAKGADIKAKTNSGETPGKIAKRHGNAQLAKALKAVISYDEKEKRDAKVAEKEANPKKKGIVGVSLAAAAAKIGRAVARAKPSGKKSQGDKAQPLHRKGSGKGQESTV